MQRPDREDETANRINALVRARSEEILLAAVSEKGADAIAAKLHEHPSKKLKVIQTWEEARATSPHPKSVEAMSWGQTRLGVGLLNALRHNCLIKFRDGPSPQENVGSLSGHLVICEDGDDFSQVIAANYAYSLGAGLALIPEVERNAAEALLDRFYSLQEDRSRSASDALVDLKLDIRNRCRDVSLLGCRSITFIGSGIPYGFAFTEIPSTHLFVYPDLGLTVANGFASQQSYSRGIDVAVLVDPKTTDAPEIETASRHLSQRRALVRRCEGAMATVRNISEIVELLPYDLLVFATHCGDVAGWRWTYEFTDSEGFDRTLVVDVGIGVANTDDPNQLHVTEFRRFISLDGVPWNDPEKKAQLHIGTAMTDFVERTMGGAKAVLQPVKKELIDRVVGAAALGMHDSNYLPILHSVADHSTPVIVNNACSSWHQLAKHFAFAGARAYLGTLFPIFSSEAEPITTSILGDRFGELLPEALWAAQNDAFRDSIRRPYLMLGVYPQSLKMRPHNIPVYLARRLARAGAEWAAHRMKTSATDEQVLRAIDARASYYRRELAALKAAFDESRERSTKQRD